MAAFWAWLVSLFSSKPVAPPPPPPAPPVLPPSPPPLMASETPWMDWMHAHIGEAEVTGQKATPFDVLVFSHTSDDEVAKSGVMAAGCAATACAALEITGYKSTHRADAISFKTYGTACELKPGCVTVFTWADGSHHVSFCVKVNSDGSADFLGGNQGGSLKISTYPQSRVIATRWPVR